MSNIPKSARNRHTQAHKTLKPNPGATTRLVAAMAIVDVLGAGRTLKSALKHRDTQLHDSRNRALAHELAYGVLRILPRLQNFANALLSKGKPLQDLDVECVLLVGIYQLYVLRIPPHAAVSATVAAAQQLGKPWAGGLVNAILRNFQRQQHLATTATHNNTTVITHCFPEWLATRLQQAWPQHAEQIMLASDQHPPMTLRVNLTRVTRHGYIEMLATQGLIAHPVNNSTTAVIIDQALDVANVPGFSSGLVSVQDGAAQLAVPLLEIPPKAQVLDACAAPGGKTAHILEACPDAVVTAVDCDANRISILRHNLSRLGLTARILVADLTASAPESPAEDPDIASITTNESDSQASTDQQLASWDDRLYDRVLLDAPCSATGVIRRHPDIKWLRRPTDIAALIITQNQILDRVWLQIRPGGVLLYVTCSVLPEENYELIAAFVNRTPDAQEWPLSVTWGQQCPIGCQVVTGDDSMDGFYFARLTKKVNSIIS